MVCFEAATSKRPTELHEVAHLRLELIVIAQPVLLLLQHRLRDLLELGHVIDARLVQRRHATARVQQRGRPRQFRAAATAAAAARLRTRAALERRLNGAAVVVVGSQ